MKRPPAEALAALALVFALVMLCLLAGKAAASEALTVPQARAIFHRAEPRGLFHGCRRASASRLLCKVAVVEVAIHEWKDPTTGEWVEEDRIAYYVPAWVPIRPGGVGWTEAKL